MRFLFEPDSLLFDVRLAYHHAHRQVAAALGWSSLDEATFWRVLRKDGPAGNFLPGAKPIKLAAYQAQFSRCVETDEVIAKFTAVPGSTGVLDGLRRFGDGHLVTLGSNAAARQRLMTSGGFAPWFDGVTALASDPRRRPAEWKALAGGDPRTIVVATSDALVRSASAADLFAVGISCGACIAARLHPAGAAMVYADLDELCAALREGAADLIRAGLPPPAMG